MTDPTLTLVVRALEEVTGHALVLDEALNVRAFTPGATELLGTEVPIGVSAAKVLCGSGPVRPVAEALSRGEPVTAEVLRPSTGGNDRMITVRATPLRDSDGKRVGWLMMLDIDPFTVHGQDALVDQWGMLTRDAGMKQLLRQLGRVAKTNASVLIRGETGSGKELVARALHAASRRADGPFRALNCAALPAALLESELFGHVRGAFTGAVRDNLGHFRLAHGGTLFLDEVGELPLEMQAKLLRVLQDKRVIPVGGREPIDVDVRIVSATHRSLRSAVRNHEFRADLMYRLRVVPLYLPPLRDRPKDVEVLAHRFAGELARDTGRVVQRIAPGALRALEEYDWPGNVRELRNVMEYALVMGDGPVLTDAELPPEVLGAEPGASKTNAGEELPVDLPAEAKRLLRALERSGGHHGRAARALGLSRVTLWRKLRRYGLDGTGAGTAPAAEPGDVDPVPEKGPPVTE